MSSSVAADEIDLPTLLRLERLERDLFRGVSRNDGLAHVFGGQVVAQALMAASQTVERARAAHSLHAYFLRSGDTTKPIIFAVERSRDGSSFTTRNVNAIQEGEVILSLMASFHIAEPGLRHVPVMPAVPHADELEPATVLYQRWLEGPRDDSPGLLPLYALAQRAGIEMRPVPVDDPSAAVQKLWLRLARRVPEDPLLQAAMLAYASDFGLLGTAKLPIGGWFGQPDMISASLDHALWFHRPPQIDQWLLYTMEAPVLHGARGYARGLIFDAQGELMASVAQEGLLRPRAPLADSGIQKV